MVHTPEKVQAQRLQYAVDLVMCIDATGSMGHLIEEVKSAALTFHDKLQTKCSAKQKKIGQLRVKVIVFRDYWADPQEMAMIESEFFDLETQGSDFENFVRKIKESGGGDEPENGLEALALALKSDWEKSQNFHKFRQVVVMYTDASAHSLEKDSKPSYYPQNLPQTLDELTDYWSDTMPPTSKRLILFAPDANPWTMIGNSWDNTIYVPSKAGAGLEELDMDEILNAIVNSL